MSDASNAFTQEWVTLQNNHEQYERSALLVKVVAILVFTVGSVWPHGTSLNGSAYFSILCFALCVLWAQEAILRTSQARLGERLLRIEACQRDGGGQALQLHSEWSASRKGSLGLFGEYARQALRPTVAFPNALLAALLAVLALCH
jgi:hypothetical protein